MHSRQDTSRAAEALLRCRSGDSSVDDVRPSGPLQHGLRGLPVVTGSPPLFSAVSQIVLEFAGSPPGLVLAISGLLRY